MQRKATLLRRPSVEQFQLPGLSENDDITCKLHALSTSASASSSSSTPDGIALLVKGKPLSVVIQVLADALLQHQSQLRRGRETAEAQTRQTEEQLADHNAVLARLKEDIHLAQRPFSFSSTTMPANCARSMRTSRRAASANTLGDAVQLLYQRTQQLQWALLELSARDYASNLQKEQRRGWFVLWMQRGARRAAAIEMEQSSKRHIVATYYARWNRCTRRSSRQRQLIRERHLRAVTRRSQKAILSVYLRKWEAFVSMSATQVAQLRAYQRRIAHVWSVSGPVVTACRRDFFQRWLRWSSARVEEKTAAASSDTHQREQYLRVHEARQMKTAFARWQERARQRQLLRLHRRLSRVLAAQNSQQLLRCHYRMWIAYAERARQMRRLEVRAADQHKRGVTALARRYFNELRFFRREKQFQRMMRSVEVSLLMLADRVGDVESAVMARHEPPAVAARPTQLFVSPPRPISSSHGAVRSAQVQWSPDTDGELRARVESLLARSR